VTILTPILLLFTLFGVLVCAWAARRWLRQLGGQQQYTANAVAIPWVVWPLALFTGLLLIAASLPGLLGQPRWFLDHVFALVQLLFG
jgi:hypothetical protein